MPSSPPASSPSPESSLPTLQGLESDLSALISERLPELPEDFTPETNLYDAGLDSMGIMHLLLAIEDRYSILIPEADVSQKNFCTVGNLAALLQARLSPQ